MLLKRSVKFYLTKVKHGQGSVRMIVSYSGKRVEFQTGVVIGTTNWDKSRCCVISYGTSSSIASNLNDQLSSMKSRMVAIFQDFEIRGIIPTSKELRNAYNGNVSEKANAEENQPKNMPDLSVTRKDTNENPAPVEDVKPKMDFWKCYDEFVKVNSKLNDWTDSTREKFAALRNHLYKFKHKLTFEYFTEDGIANLIDYYGKQGFKNSSINNRAYFSVSYKYIGKLFC